MHPFKMFHIFVPNLGEIYHAAWSQNGFFSETKEHLSLWQLKKPILGLKTAFIWCVSTIQRVKQDLSIKWFATR